MSDPKAFEAALDASGTFEHETNGARFRLRSPFDQDFRIAHDSSLNADGLRVDAVAARVLLERSIIGWSGLTENHLDAERLSDPVPFSSAIRTRLLDHRQDIADDLMDALLAFRKSRREKQEAARKNSDAASSSTSTVRLRGRA